MKALALLLLLAGCASTAQQCNKRADEAMKTKDTGNFVHNVLVRDNEVRKCLGQPERPMP